MQQRTVTRRLPPEIFDLPVEKMREGYYTDAYFNHTRQVLLRDGRHPRVVMQVFQKRHSFLGGIDEAIAVLKLCAEDWEDLTVHALYDGDQITPYEPVLRIEGDYTGFAHLETVYLGVLARRTLISTNTTRVRSLRASTCLSTTVNGSSMLAMNTRPMTLTTPIDTRPSCVRPRNEPLPGAPAG